MNLTVFGPTLLAAGIAALAFGLYVMQRLRVRHREVEVVTTLFWREALEERRARVFTRRFRHPWAYALLVAIASLLWLLIGGPRANGTGGARTIILLDGSAGMSGDRFDEAVVLARAIAADLPSQRREVRLVGGSPVVVLGTDEALPLFDARMEGRMPVEAPGGFETALLDLAVTTRAHETLIVHLVGDAPVRPEVLASLPTSMVVGRAPSRAADGRKAITSLGISGAASGAWEAVDVLFDIAPSPVDLAGAVEVSLDGAPLDQPVERDGAGRCVVRDLPARGGVLTVRLAEGAPDGRQVSASIAIPDRPLIRVHLDADAPALLRLALEVDPAVRFVDTAAEAEVRIGRDPSADFVVAADDSGAAFHLVTDAPEADPSIMAPALIDELALAQIDADRLAEQAGRAVRLDIEPGTVRRMRVWRSLFGDSFDFARGRACPVFVASAVRWLAARPEIVPWAAAGEPLPIDATFRDRAETAGPYTTIDGRVVRVAVLEPMATAVEAEAAVDDTAGRGADVFGLVGLMLVVLLGVEWVLYQRGRMP
ncbi:MAG: hypothetical protein ACYTF9_02395 [Planctomycetota bacterium]|jgi:hypothetical protein